MCYDKSLNGHLDVKTFSGTSVSTKDKECNIGTRTDVLHIVRLHNLRTYPADITCNASLNANPKLKFESTIQGDPDTSVAAWKVPTFSLGQNAKRDFSHVKLFSLKAGGGYEPVDITVQADWPISGKTLTIPLTITVTA